MLRKFGTLDDVGVYSLAYKFGFLVQFLFIANFHMVWDPRVFDLAKRRLRLVRSTRTYFEVLRQKLKWGER